MKKTVTDLKKEKSKIEKVILKLQKELQPLNQESTIANLKTPVTLLGGSNDNDYLYISVQDGNGKVHSFEDHRDNDYMGIKFRALLCAANPLDRSGWRKKGTILFN